MSADELASSKDSSKAKTETPVGFIFDSADTDAAGTSSNAAAASTKPQSSVAAHGDGVSGSSGGGGRRRKPSPPSSRPRLHHQHGRQRPSLGLSAPTGRQKSPRNRNLAKSVESGHLVSAQAVNRFGKQQFESRMRCVGSVRHPVLLHCCVPASQPFLDFVRLGSIHPVNCFVNDFGIPRSFIFFQIDTKRDNVIDVEELHQVMQRLLPNHDTQKKKNLKEARAIKKRLREIGVLQERQNELQSDSPELLSSAEFRSLAEEEQELEERLAELPASAQAARLDGEAEKGPAHASEAEVLGVEAVPSVEEMIWEIDDSTDGTIGWAEFVRAYRRASNDWTGFEPRKLAWLIEFLMMDEHNQGFVTEAQISDLMVMRCGPHGTPPLLPQCCASAASAAAGLANQLTTA